MAKEDVIREYLATIGSQGGKAKVKKGFSMATAEERAAAGRKGAEKRWGTKKVKAKSAKAKKAAK